jgi:hypothetical protein
MRKNTPIEWIVIEDESAWQRPIPPARGETNLAMPAGQTKPRTVR